MGGLHFIHREDNTMDWSHISLLRLPAPCVQEHPLHPDAGAAEKPAQSGNATQMTLVLGGMVRTPIL